jgi:hypothetical protein
MSGMGYQFLAWTGVSAFTVKPSQTTHQIITHTLQCCSTAVAHKVSNHRWECIQKETSNERERERDTSKGSKTTQCKLKVCTFKSITPVTTLALDTDIPVYQTHQCKWHNCECPRYQEHYCCINPTWVFS